jgi:hypothetical protein
MTGVQPTGTSSGQWSTLAKELTAETLNDQIVHVVFQSESANIENHPVVIYVDAKTTDKQYSSNLKGHTFDGVEFVRFADILNNRGYALLLEKQAPLNNMLLSNQKAIQNQAATLVAMPSLLIEYQDAELPKRMYKNLQNNMDAEYEAIVRYVHPRVKTDSGLNEYFCYVNLETNKLSSLKALNDMKVDFEKCYKSNENCRMPMQTIEEAMRQKRKRQACVCKPASDFRFYRGEIIDTTDDDNCFLVKHVDSGQVSIVHYINIYRAMTKYLRMHKLAFKVKINVDPNIMVEEVNSLDLFVILFFLIFSYYLNIFF